MDSGFDIMQKSVVTVEKAGDALNKIVSAVAEVSQLVRDIENEAISQTKESTEIVQGIEEIAKSAEQTANSANVTHDAVDLQQKSLSDIAQAVDVLANTSEELTGLVAKFKTK